MPEKLQLPTDREWEILAAAWSLCATTHPEGVDSTTLYTHLIEKKGFEVTYGSISAQLVRLREKGWLGYTRGKPRYGRLYYLKPPDNVDELIEIYIAHRLRLFGDHLPSLEALRKRVDERIASLRASSKPKRKPKRAKARAS